jgi:ring-1,2-phenylacetyl-CoA epoxidase subunit PaaE
MKSYTLRVCEIRNETEDCITLCFKQPGLRKIKYIAGQYLTLIFRINGRRYIRPYSFSSSPAVDDLLEITIKRVPNGIVSNHIHDAVAVGDSIETMEPMGDFIHENFNDEVYLWGVGSGITPLFSIAKQLLSDSQLTRVYLIYGNRNHESTIFSSRLKDLSRLHPDQFFVRHFHTQLNINQDIPGLIEGRINFENAIQILNALNCSKSSVHYICGPPGLKSSVKEALKFHGIADENVKAEDFELIKDPKDFENIQTQQVRLKFENREFELEITKGKTILESALDAGIELPYSCQTGNCSTCKGRLVLGEAKMIGLTKKRDDLLNNEYLLCCTHPISNDVNIEVT